MVCGTDLWDKYMSFEQKDYTAFPTLYIALRERALQSPEKTALVMEDGAIYNYQTILRMTDAFAMYLQEKEAIQQGDHVGILLYNGVDFCVSFLALLKIGAVVVPLPGKFRKQEILSLIKKANLSLLICDNDYKNWFEEKELSYFHKMIVSEDIHFDDIIHSYTSVVNEQPCLDLDAPAILMFTSGTTSKSKGVILTNNNIMYAVFCYQQILGICQDDRALLSVPIYHITGLVGILGTMIYAGGLTYIQKFFKSDKVIDIILKENITYFHASPTVFSMILKERSRISSLPSVRIIACGSSNMPKEKILELHEWMPNMEFRTVYGLTETASPATIFPTDAATSPYIGSSGIPIPRLKIKIVDDAGEELPSMKVGEILLQGPNLLQGYFGTDIQAYENGWFHTGDCGYLNDDGYLYICDRKKDMINRGGEKICSYDVENVIYGMDQVEEVAVVGVPDDIYGEVAAAAIVLKPGAALTLDELRLFLKDKLATYKIPVYLKLLDNLPETVNRKIDKKAVQKLFKE